MRSQQFAQTSGVTVSKPSWTRRFTSSILYVVLFVATWPLTRAHTSSIGLSSQWPTGERRTSTPCSAASLSTIYFGFGLCCFTSMYSTDLRAVGVWGDVSRSQPLKDICRLGGRSRSNCILCSSVVLWCVIQNHNRSGRQIGEKLVSPPLFKMRLVHLIVVIGRPHLADKHKASFWYPSMAAASM